MNIKQFKYVLELADTKSFGRAAENLNISQPSLSQYIKNIEKGLGVELFDRSGGGVRLTDAGRIYIEAGKKILALEREMYSDFADLSEHKTGTVTVGTSPYRSATLMPEATCKFHEKYPDMCVVVEEMTTDELLLAVERGDFDFALTVSPVDERKFDIEFLREEALVLAVPKSFEPLSLEKSDSSSAEIDVRCIDGKKFVTIGENQPMQKALGNICLDFGINVKSAAVVKSLEAQFAMVQSGVGMALVPEGIKKLSSNDNVVFYKFKQKLPKREVVAVFKKGKAPNAPTKDLIKTIKEIK